MAKKAKEKARRMPRVTDRRKTRSIEVSPLAADEAVDEAGDDDDEADDGDDESTTQNAGWHEAM